MRILQASSYHEYAAKKDEIVGQEAGENRYNSPNDPAQDDRFGNAGEHSAFVVGACARRKDYVVERRIAHRVQKLHFLPPRRRDGYIVPDLPPGPALA